MFSEFEECEQINKHQENNRNKMKITKNSEAEKYTSIKKKKNQTFKELMPILFQKQEKENTSILKPDKNKRIIGQLVLMQKSPMKHKQTKLS